MSLPLRQAGKQALGLSFHLQGPGLCTGRGLTYKGTQDNVDEKNEWSKRERKRGSEGERDRQSKRERRGERVGGRERQTEGPVPVN